MVTLKGSLQQVIQAHYGRLYLNPIRTGKFCLRPLTALLGHPVQKYFVIFCFNQKIFLQTLVKIILDKIRFKFLGQPKRIKGNILHMECWVSK